jgi:hypothetical protein
VSLPRFLLLCAFAFPSLARADFAGLPQQGTQSVAYVGFGAAPGKHTVTFGYAYDAAEDDVECPTSVFLEARALMPSRDRHDVEEAALAFGMRFTLLRFATFAAPVQAGLVLRGAVASDDVHLALDTEVAVMPGFYTRSFAIAADLALLSRWARYDAIVQTGEQHLTRDGEQELRLGLRASGVIAGRVEVIGRVGYADLAHVTSARPTYGDVTVGVRF